ncbi:DUF2235 domain-containing protein [Halomonas sp. ATBC28]|uniref:DUF2235 domain-containing protein n=1 Tax=Halomonas sp. ATBC28 TaxID=2545264 RepID=UPI00110E3D8C|nr:DUF2235 domain-containing protein [Halomonas sp. ATBC28]TMU14866.1 DUF2235 domain-containing protein [Halomonas sp. ATBC28]
MVRFFSLILIMPSFLFLASCSSIFSGAEPQPLSFSDREIAKNATLKLGHVPSFFDLSKTDETKIYVFAFDGTENDRNNINDAKERQTTVGYLTNKLEEYGYDVEYLEGPGINSKLDSAFCYSCSIKADEALSSLNNKIENEISTSSGVDVKVVVLGFSRGAAIGRHFMNLVSQNWPIGSVYNVRSYGLLFDTVATSVVDNLLLGIAPTTDYLIHIVARDERRKLFPVIIDKDLAYESEVRENMVTTPRLTQLELPGVHSDIGASYISGIGTFYRFIGGLLLSNYGLISQNEMEFSEDFFNQGSHDSRGWLSKAAGIESYLVNPSDVRQKEIVNSVPISKGRAEDLAARNVESIQNSSSSYYSYNELSPIFFDVLKSDDTLRVISGYASNLVEVVNLSFEDSDGIKRINFRYKRFPDKKQFLNIEESLWKAIPENKVSRIELVSLERGDESNSCILVNGQLITKCF